jgi:hypothetical protein
LKKGLKKSYKIATLEKHLKIEKVGKEKLLDRLNELNDEAFTFKHQQNVQGVKHDHKEDFFNNDFSCDKRW